MALVSETPTGLPYASEVVRPDIQWTQTTRDGFWRAAENAFVDLAQAGAELVLVVRIGAYADIDYEELIQFHLDKGCRVAAAYDGEGGPLDILSISASRRNDAAFLFRHELRQFRTTCEEYKFHGYVNRLENAADLRRLTMDAFLGNVAFKPIGTEIRPGVWAGEGARIHRQARILAPAFIGDYAKIRAQAVITRGSSVSHHAEVDCGTVIESSNILPYACVGAALDVMHSVVGFRHIANLRRDVEIEIADPKLTSMTAVRAPIRAVSSALSLAALVPRSIFKSVFDRKRKAPAALPDAISTPPSTLNIPEEASQGSGRFRCNHLVPARRYGDE
jgi:NDP-sugar pyrophosphorylase family protein